MNRILLGVWVRSEKRKLKGGGTLIIPDAVINEDKWQGVTALVLKMGPHCYAPNSEIEWADEDRIDVGDWVLFRRGDGFRLRLNGQECVMMESERGIKMVLPRPDMAF